MSHAIERLLQEAEVKKLQIEMQLRFTHNIEAFSSHFPSIANTFANRKMHQVQLQLDSSNQLNLFDKHNKQWFYPKPAPQYAQQLVDKLIREGQPHYLRFAESRVNNPEHLHIPMTNALIETLNETGTAIKTNNRKNIYNLILTGSGLAYQLPILLKDAHVYNIFIYEKNLDIFQASLFCIDWAAIIQHFLQPGYSITFCLGVEVVEALAQVQTTTHKRGLFNSVYTYVLQHSPRKEETAFIAQYKRDLPSYVGSLGFFDDEQIGLAHGIENLKRQDTFFLAAQCKAQSCPIFVIGNGPSLDKHAAYLRHNRDNAIIMSCGTALGSLYKMGIKPHYHIEMERTQTMQDFITYGTDEDFRKGIQLLCLHTISPETINLFDSSCLGIKPNDACSHLIKKALAPADVLELSFCNPTVANCGFSFAIAMGFRKIHLIGTDFGIWDSGEHHSKQSTHYTLESKEKNKDNFRYNYKDDRNIEIAANFGGKVRSHGVLNTARISVERYLHLASQLIPDLKVINSNFGAAIAGTEACKPEELPDYTGTSPQSTLDSIEDTFFLKTNADTKKEIDVNKALEYFFSIENDLKISENIACEEELYYELHRLFTLISETRDITTNMLLRGSLNTWFGICMEHCFYLKNENDFKKQVSIVSESYNDFIRRAYEKIRKSALQLDATRSDLFEDIRNTDTTSPSSQETSD